MNQNPVLASSFNIAFFFKEESVTPEGFKTAYDDTVGAYTTATQFFSEDLIQTIRAGWPEGYDLKLPEAEKAFIVESSSPSRLTGSYFGDVNMPAEEVIRVLTNAIQEADFPHGFVMLSLFFGENKKLTNFFVMDKTENEFSQVAEEEWARLAEVNDTFI